MKLLLTSNGIANKSIEQALAELLGKPFAESRIVFIPTAANAEPEDKQWLINDYGNTAKLDFKNLYIVDLAVSGLEKNL